MKIVALCFVLITATLAAEASKGQPAQHFEYPAQRGSASPPSTLTITRIPAPAAPPAPVPQDSPESVRIYEQCVAASDRAARSNAEMLAGLARCLKELEARRHAP